MAKIYSYSMKLLAVHFQFEIKNNFRKIRKLISD